jgi:hypothetical protein
MTINFNSFDVDLFVDFRLYWDSEFCFGFGYTVQQITLSFLMGMKFMNCYKVVLDSFPFCLFTYWTGKGAKVFDVCR